MMNESNQPSKKTNYLINEKSPYLLQHAYNPVNWYAWGEEAFHKAKTENKPIFLSIGYSTCHWCHVMEHESFEDAEVAAKLNDKFVAIKVDREERPDIDSIYMSVAQLTTGRGGWPLTIFMTPDKQPFFAGTYFPKTSRFGATGLMELLDQISNVWENKRNEILETAEKITDVLQKAASPYQTEYNGDELIIRAFDELDNRFDEKLGGFANAPKFPSPHNLIFLLRYWKRFGDKLALSMVETTLQKMRLGGIFDHIGLGFHRYSTDREWLVPHFEKMLYDQAMLSIAYTETYQATKKETYKEVAQSILEYVLRDMTSSEGGFYSAEDADSEGVEGKFYVWKMSELKEILNEEEIKLFSKLYKLDEEGNYLEEATKEKTGDNIIHLKGFPSIKEKKLLELIRLKLFEIREKRIHPLKDDKILTDWNGLMVVALAKAARVYDEPKYQEAAEKAVKFITNKLTNNENRLIHRYREEASLTANLDDYAFLIWGLLELYETSFNIEYLEKALTLNSIAIKHFWDEKNGGFYFTPDDGEKLLVREKLIYDGAIPSGNSVMMLNLLKLSRIYYSPELEEKAALLMAVFAKQVSKVPSAFTFLISSLDYAIGPAYEIVLVGKETDSNTKAMLDILKQDFLPNKVVIFKNTDKENEIEQILNHLKDFKAQKSKTTAYVCEQFSCQRPTTEIDMMKNQLGLGE